VVDGLLTETSGEKFVLPFEHPHVTGAFEPEAGGE
jgi:hypothetical protein